jgi:MoaA/NifB/PqqE/SkfB family radical SAM enzyme
VLDALIDAGATRIALSIHSHRAAVEDALCGRKGAFAQKMKAIDLCLAALAAGRLPDGFSINACVHGKNLAELDAMARFLHARGVRDLRINSLRPEHEAVGDKAIVPRLTDVVPELMRLVVLNERTLRMTVTFGDIPLCLWPPAFLARHAIAGRYLGELRDFDTSVTVFRDQSDEGAPDRFNWKERRQGRLKTHPPACRRCRARGTCEGVWTRYLEMYGEGEIHAITDT